MKSLLFHYNCDTFRAFMTPEHLKMAFIVFEMLFTV